MAAASRTHVPVRSSTASVVSAISTTHPKGVKTGSTTCSTSQLYGGKTGWLTAKEVNLYRPLPAS